MKQTSRCRIAGEAMNPNERTTGRMPEMLQDCDRRLSRALSNTPDARLHAREAAAAGVTLVDPAFRHEWNCGARFATAGECTCGVMVDVTPGYCNPVTGEPYLRHADPVRELVEAAVAVVQRWDSPLWKDLPHTGEYIHRLRIAAAGVDVPREGQQ